jgi:hypothetical protein
MTIYNSIPSSGESGNTRKVGDIYSTSQDNADANAFTLTNEKQTLDGTLAPDLLALSNYRGNAGLISLEFLKEDVNMGNQTDGYISINKAEGETYLIGRGTESNGLLVRINNNDFDNPELLAFNWVTGGLFQKIFACFKGDDLHMSYTNGSSCYHIVYNTLNNTFTTQTTVASAGSSGHSQMALRYIETIDKVVLIIKSSSSSCACYTTSDGVIFNLENTFSGYISDIGTANQNILRFDKEGTNNYYDSKFWFLRSNGLEVFSIDINTFSLLSEQNVSGKATSSSFTYTVLQCTTSGIFYFPIGYTLNTEIEFLYSDDGMLTFNFLLSSSMASLSVNNIVFYLIDNNSAIIKDLALYSNVYISYNLNLINNFNALLTLTAYNQNEPYSVVKDGDNLNIFYQSSSSNGVMQVTSYTMTESASPLVLPVAPNINSQYEWRVVYK